MKKLLLSSIAVFALMMAVNAQSAKTKHHPSLVPVSQAKQLTPAEQKKLDESKVQQYETELKKRNQKIRTEAVETANKK
jgi:hypothetical protein